MRIDKTLIKLARILYPVNSLGPGNRLGIWLYGCPRRCSGCANPELWMAPEGCEVDLDVIKNAVEGIQNDPNLPPIDGVTISGGEPFSQPEALEQMVDYFKSITEDILVFTGYEREELEGYEEKLISKISVLIDGVYIKEKNTAHPLKGSENQIIHFINHSMIGKYEAYIERLANHPMAQVFPVSDGKIVAGIHKEDFQEEYRRRLEKDSRLEQWQKT